jgi:uncharacterized protein
MRTRPGNTSGESVYDIPDKPALIPNRAAVMIGRLSFSFLFHIPVGSLVTTRRYITCGFPLRCMANIGFFDIPANDVGRAKSFYHKLLGWKIEPAEDFPFPEQQRHTIVTGGPAEGTVNIGGLYKRHGPGPILIFSELADIDAVLAKVEKLSGKIVLPRGGVEGVGFFAVIADTEGNMFGLHQKQA